MFQLTRHEGGPILTPDKNYSWENEGVFNPGVIKVGEEVIMLYRAVGERDSYISHIGLAKSHDGISFTRAGVEPVFGPSEVFDTWATEDPRITQIGSDFYVTYVAVPERIMDHGRGIDRPIALETSTALLKTQDFVSFENLGVISPLHSDNKDIVLFPKKLRRVNKETGEAEGLARYAILHRPNRWSKDWFQGSYGKTVDVPLPCAMEDIPTIPSIWISWSDDLKNWTDHQPFMRPSHHSDAKIGPGLPPIETEKGWLLIYHHVEMTEIENSFRYSTRVALLDLDDPTHIIAKLPYEILAPEMPYEIEQQSKIVFPTGGYVSDGTLYVYYGASDRYVCMASGSLNELLDELQKHATVNSTNVSV